MSIRREIIDCGSMGSRNVSRPPDNDNNNNEEIENNIDQSSTESFRYESNEDLSTTDKIFFDDSENSLSDEEFQGVLERTYVNHDNVTDDSYIPTGNKYVNHIQSLTGLHVVETRNVWNAFDIGPQKDRASYCKTRFERSSVQRTNLPTNEDVTNHYQILLKKPKQLKCYFCIRYLQKKNTEQNTGVQYVRSDFVIIKAAIVIPMILKV